MDDPRDEPLPRRATPATGSVVATLRAEIARLRRAGFATELHLDRLDAENERLREALTALVLQQPVDVARPSEDLVVDLRTLADPVRLPTLAPAQRARGATASRTDRGRRREVGAGAPAAAQHPIADPQPWQAPRLPRAWPLLAGALAAVGFAGLQDQGALPGAGAWTCTAASAFAVGLAATALQRTRRQAIRMAAQVSARGEALDRARDRDPVTGSLNGRAFSRALDGLLAMTSPGTSLEVAILEVDQVQGLAHWMGGFNLDGMLTEMAVRLGAQRGVAVAGHLGDGRFIVAGPTQLLDAAAAGRALATTVETSIGPIDVTVTVGVRRVSAGDKVAASSAVIEASLAAAAARREGARTKRFTQDLVDDAVWQAEDSALLGHAIDQGDVGWAWQPVRDAETLRPVGFETLARWEDPERGPIPAERWVRSARAEDLARFEAMLLIEAATTLQKRLPDSDEWVSVNLSTSHLLHFDAASAIAAALDQSGLAPHRLVLEVTEREDLVLADAVDAMSDLSTLYGVRFALDDVGAGYSTLRWLFDLPASIIKLDRSVTHSLGSDPVADGLVRSMAQWAADSHRLLVVEGVETVDHYHRCRALGIRAAQGWLLGRPAATLEEAIGTPVDLTRAVRADQPRPR